MYQIPSHLGGNQQQHNAKGDFEFSGGQLVRRFYAERRKEDGGNAQYGHGRKIDKACCAFRQVGNMQTVGKIADSDNLRVFISKDERDEISTLSETY